MARRARRSSPPPTRKNARSRSGCFRSGCAAARRSSLIRDTFSRELAATIAQRYNAHILRPARKDEPGHGPHLAPIRQCIESIFWTLKDQLGLERHNTRTLHGLRARIATKLLALAAGVWLNHYLNRPSRAFADLSR
jgi:hypothetical protein